MYIIILYNIYDIPDGDMHSVKIIIMSNSKCNAYWRSYNLTLNLEARFLRAVLSLSLLLASKSSTNVLCRSENENTEHVHVQSM